MLARINELLRESAVSLQVLTVGDASEEEAALLLHAQVVLVGVQSTSASATPDLLL